MTTPRLADRPIYYLVLMFIALLLNYLDRSILSVLLVPLKPALHLSDTNIGFLTGFGFVLFYAFIGLPLARLADHRGRHLVVGGGMLLWSLATAACGLAGSMGGLLVARAGVGIGEAAGTGPSLALVGDQFPKEKRPLVLSIVNAGGALGTALGLGLGGAIAQLYGWRVAFVLAGAPGLIIGILIAATLRDRRLGSSPDLSAGATLMPNIGATIRFITRQKSILLTFAGSIFLGLLLTVVATWTPTYFARVHSLSLIRIGVTLGLIKGIAGIAGALCGGIVTTALARRDDRWQARIPGLACMLTVPAYLLFLRAASPSVAFAAVGAGVFFMSAALGPVFSIYQCTTMPRLRSQVTSLHILIASIGIGVGPLLVGYLDDHVFAAQGALALRSSLLIIPAAGFVAALLYGFAARFIIADMARAASAEGASD